MSTKRRKYDEEFKKRAVRMSYTSERTVTEVADSLGITANMIYRWRQKYTPAGDKTQIAQQQDEMSELRSRIAELEEENCILKKAWEGCRLSKVFSLVGLEANTGIRDTGIMSGIPEVEDIQNSTISAFHKIPQLHIAKNCNMLNLAV